jgi:hypothetical protein
MSRTRKLEIHIDVYDVYRDLGPLCNEFCEPRRQLWCLIQW